MKLYGSPGSSAGRCHWFLNELGVDYENPPLDMRAKQHKSPEYLKLNPNGKIPTLVDGELVMWESLAINFYLAEKYPSPLFPRDLNVRALVYQWSAFALCEMQPPLVNILIQKVFVPEERRDQKVIDDGIKNVTPRLEVLNNHLANRKYVASDEFTLADLNLASVANIARSLNLDMAAYPHILRWLKACTDRPAFQKIAPSQVKT